MSEPGFGEVLEGLEPEGPEEEASEPAGSPEEVLAELEACVAKLRAAMGPADMEGMDD